MRGAHAIGVAALVVAMSGTAYGAAKITGKDVADGSLTGRDVRNKSLTGRDIRNNSLTSRDVRGLTRNDFKAGELPGSGGGGSSGANGQNGQDGTSGQNGATGATGPRGPQGPVGPRGPQGPLGPVGPQGPQGAPGANGTNGLNGVLGYESASTSGNASAEGVADVIAPCSPGKVALGGGWSVPSDAAAAVVTFNGPNSASSWRVRITGLAPSAPVTVYATCATQP